MKKDSLVGLVKNLQSKTAEHSGEILLGVGILTSVSTTIMAVKVTPKALQLLKEKQNQSEDAEPLTKMEVIKTTYKVYIPAIALGLVSVTCLVASGTVNSRKHAALATVATISETALREYQEKVIEVIGEEKEREVRDAVAAEQIRKNPIGEKEIVITNGKVACLDALSGRYFESTVNDIERAENELNRQLLQDGYVALNDLYFLLGLKGIELGEELGWNSENGLIEIYYSSQLNEKNEPCLVIAHRLPPTYGYKHFGSF